MTKIGDMVYTFAPGATSEPTEEARKARWVVHLVVAIDDEHVWVTDPRAGVEEGASPTIKLNRADLESDEAIATAADGAWVFSQSDHDAREEWIIDPNRTQMEREIEEDARAGVEELRRRTLLKRG